MPLVPEVATTSVLPILFLANGELVRLGAMLEANRINREELAVRLEALGRSMEITPFDETRGALEEVIGRMRVETP